MNMGIQPPTMGGGPGGPQEMVQIRMQVVTYYVHSKAFFLGGHMSGRGAI